MCRNSVFMPDWTGKMADAIWGGDPRPGVRQHSGLSKCWSWGSSWVCRDSKHGDAAIKIKSSRRSGNTGWHFAVQQAKRSRQPELASTSKRAGQSAAGCARTWVSSAWGQSRPAVSPTQTNTANNASFRQFCSITRIKPLYF